MKHKNRQFGRGVSLATSPVDGGTWNILAYAVELKNRKAALTKETFVQCVANFARYPKVPVVINHADTSDGPPEWAAPHGWITELRVGTAERNGITVATLEGRVLLDAATKPLVTAEVPTWPYGSVTVYFDVPDEETGANTGAMLWSFSLTDHPALVDVPRLAASRSVSAGWYYGNVDDREDLLCALRAIFDLPALATEADVVGALDKFEAMLANPETAQGIELDELLEKVREALRIPALSTSTEVVETVRRGLATMPSEATVTQLSRGDAANKEHGMKTALMLAAALGIVAKDEAAAQAALLPIVEEALNTREALNLGATATSTQVTAAITKAVTDAAKLQKAEAELSTHRKAAADALALTQSRHIDELIAAQPELKSTRKSLELHARQDWAGFQTEYPAPSREELAQRAQDPARLQSITVSTKRPVTDTDSSSAKIVEQAHTMIDEARANGFELSFSDALSQLG